MASWKPPSTGVLLRHDTKATNAEDAPTQVIRLDLGDSATKDLLRSLRQNEPVRLRGGKKPTVQIGKKSVTLETSAVNFPSELYSASSSDSGHLYFSGKLSHTLEVQKAEEVTAKSDEALAALESTLKSIQEQRASNETSIIGSKSDKRNDKGVSPLLSQNSSLRKDHLLAGINRSTPSSPFLSASYSPRQGPTSAPLASGVSSKDQIRLDAIRKPLIHLLAIKPLTSRGVAEKLRAPRDDVEKVLDKVARDTKVGDGRKELKEKSYRELDVFEFRYRTDDDRQAAINNAITVFDRTRVDKKDPLWQLLLPKEERGQGKCLSRLNFEKPPPVPSHATPRPTDDGSDTKPETSDREQANNKTKKNTATPLKKAKEKSIVSRVNAKADTTKSPRSKDTVAKPAKSEGKFKSSERIEDSDEEAEAAEVEVVKAKPIAAARASVNPRKNAEQESSRPLSSNPTSTTKTLHKSSLSSSSSSSYSGNEKARPAASASTKSLKTGNAAESTSSMSRISPRPRHGISPQKPSPLGSSPPTTSTDVSNSGPSSKASNQSSAPSSPPSDSDIPKPKQQTSNKYSPVIKSDHTKSRNTPRGGSPLRTKAETANAGRPSKRKTDVEDDRPSKRQQTANFTPHTQAKSMPDDSGAYPSRPSAPIRQSSDAGSVRSSSPEKRIPRRADVIVDAKRFQKYYRKYKDLHERISSVDEKDRDPEDMSNLWRMHKRLTEMKADIWGNWDKVEKISKMGKVDKAVRHAVAVG
ncbi:hypothetical protein PV10_03400 [Exophiala mesophila]|uniref:Uncharacterized protein n=1 Tax=Exophiala mesophila TaxID=212818 RepID=A0A0D1Y520_EXOME|nr:uncharacterized protein PV10_03400 [Exophiala mesophila]KIV95786.1 hypothetical protein PV10_03400 [Exophiala mesophila]